MAIIDGTPWSDEIQGTSWADDIYGYGGDDLIFGNGGADNLYGGAGWDELHGSTGNDWLFGGTGANDLYGGSDADRFIVTGSVTSFSDDWIFDFQPGLDRIDVSAWGVSDFSQLKELFKTDSDGNAYIDAFYRGEDHYLTVQDLRASDLIASDFIYDNGGRREMYGTNRADVLFGSQNGDILHGRDHGDSLLGGKGWDDLYGDGGNDRLIGGNGSDILDGGRGGDKLKGGAGDDTFLFRSLTDVTAAQHDTILDFRHGQDLIDVERIDARGGISGDQDFSFIGTSNFAHAGQLRYETVGNTTYLMGNTNADLNAEFTIVINGSIALSGSDFIL